MKKTICLFLSLVLVLGIAQGAPLQVTLAQTNQSAPMQVAIEEAPTAGSAQGVAQSVDTAVNAIATQTPTVYRDDFEDEPANADPSHWVETYNDDSMQTQENVTQTLLLTDDFSATSKLSERGWATNMTVQNGQLVTNRSNLLSGVAGSTEWQDYCIEADVTVDETTYNSSGTSVSGLLGRSTAAGTNGLEFALFVPTPNYTQGTMEPLLRLYDRGGKKQLASVKFSDYAPNTTYRLKMLLFGTRVRCYVDGVLYIDTNCEVLQGSAGIVANNFITSFDNLRISAVEAFSVENTVVDYFKTATQSQNRVYRGASKAFAATWLHAFEQNPTVTADLTFETLPQTGKVGLLGRYHARHTYLQGGYDFAQQKWYIASRLGYDFEEQIVYSAAATVKADKTYRVQLQIEGEIAILYVDGVIRVVSTQLTLVSYGRVGLFVEGAEACFDNVEALYPSGVSVTSGVVSWDFHKDSNKSFLEIDVIGNEVLGFDSVLSVYSNNYGKTFQEGSGGYKICVGGDYSSTIEVQKGQYLRILHDPMRAQVSADLVNWTTAATIVPEEECTDPETGNKLTLVHVGTLTKIALPNGKDRIFCPIAFRVYKGTRIVGHITRVYYTDDGGYTWQKSKNDTTEIPNYEMNTTANKLSEGSSFCEAKVISCSDGTLRMYCTRTWATCVHYVESSDYGETWSNFGTLPDMPCAISSFGICADPANPGTWYMVYVKDVPPDPDNAFPRTHLVLAKTTDGKTWQEVMSLDRTPDVWQGSKPVYQLLDPSITVTEGYIYVGYGRSDIIDDRSHNAQRQRYLRIEREHTHKYDDGQDLTCNVCEYVREAPKPYVVGDVNGDNEVSDADATYLLMHTFFADFYPVNQDCDFNGDSVVSDADATYLLMHTFFPDFYPIE